SGTRRGGKIAASSKIRRSASSSAIISATQYRSPKSLPPFANAPTNHRNPERCTLSASNVGHHSSSASLRRYNPGTSSGEWVWYFADGRRVICDGSVTTISALLLYSF